MNRVPPAPPASGVPLTERFRELMSLFPTGVSVVTTLDGLGQPRGMTCTSLTSVALHPPTLLVCLRLGSGTMDAVLESHRFAVNVLHAGARRVAELFSGPVPDRFEHVRWRSGPSGLPLLVEEVVAAGECRVSGLVEVLDHAVVLGEVVHVTTAEGSPLLYGMRQFGVWTPPVSRARRA